MNDMDYAFNATALGLGGVRESDGVTTIFPSLGSVVLSSTGGEGSSEILNYNRDGISFGAMQTRVSGSRVSDTLFCTTSDVRLSYVNLFGRLRVNQMRLSLTSTRHLDREEDEALFEVQASYRGVVIDDEELIPELDVEMCSLQTYDQFLQEATENAAHIAEKLEQDEQTVREMATRRVPPIIRGSIVADIRKSENSRLIHRRNRVHVPGLGQVKFGELLLKQGRRRINLLRFDFGDHLQETHTSEHGSMVMGSGEGNGMPIWPNG